MQQPKENSIGDSNLWLATLEQASALAALNRPVLILGERGTGKELIAQRLHYLSPRWQAPFITVNCAALNDNLLDSELFGHEAGSFTGAQKRHLGRFERADGGTLFLDELAAAPLLVQEKLLRVIEYGELERVGGQQALQVEVRIICATNEDLPALVQQGKFRADLLDRLAFEVVHLAPLRERQEDILQLAHHFALQMCRELDRPLFAGFSAEACRRLRQWPWRGNIRELKNVIERSVYRQQGEQNLLDEIIFDPFPSTAQRTSAAPSDSSSCPLPSLPLDLRAWQSEQERAILEQSLVESHYRQTEAAQRLGLSYHQFRALLKKHQITAVKR